MFNPWATSYEEARTEQERAGYSADPAGPLSQWVAAQEINQRKSAVEKGDGFAVLACVRIVMTSGLIAPDWLTYAFNRRYDAVLNCRAKSWDDPKSFGQPYPKGFNRAAAEKRRLRQWQVWNKANEIKLREPDRPIDEAFFERVGKEVRPPCGKTVASDLYYEIKEWLG